MIQGGSVRVACSGYAEKTIQTLKDTADGGMEGYVGGQNNQE